MERIKKVRRVKKTKRGEQIMKVIFKCDNPDLFYRIVNAFTWAKENDVADMASLEITDTSATYRTCCDNIWFVERRGETVIFGYEGTRAGAIRLMPFAYLLDWKSYDPPILECVTDYKKEEFTIVPLKTEEYELEVVYYETTTPNEWNLKWYHQVVKVDDKNAVIMEYNSPIKKKEIDQ
jgi:hypothetical protein